ncbi:hypothetical protein [Nocardia pseudobrasiliensis]|uniref:Uncharacterized protein n=1 Tax=Nocardia pseudobrasiliensis TaxID=45979 RepID=A0A370IA85_9NOCA|nr:hypothetical protein [Nocardia pseudobrasiliensis]RDI67623.1 hypothetical protein DFR76_10220 [Nocardia pseudobrasiliensis]
MGQRVTGAIEWSVPFGAVHPDQACKPIAVGFRAYCPPGWLLLELPTALLLAVFVGTGWLGYAQPATPGSDRPAHAVVVPAEGHLPSLGTPR